MRLTTEVNKLSAVRRLQNLKIVARMKKLALPFRSPEHVGQMILDYAKTMSRGEVKDEVTFIGQTLKDNPELCYPEFYAYFKARNKDKSDDFRRAVNGAIRSAVSGDKRTEKEIAKWKVQDQPEVWGDALNDSEST